MPATYFKSRYNPRYRSYGRGKFKWKKARRRIAKFARAAADPIRGIGALGGLYLTATGDPVAGVNFAQNAGTVATAADVIGGRTGYAVPVLNSARNIPAARVAMTSPWAADAVPIAEAWTPGPNSMKGYNTNPTPWGGMGSYSRKRRYTGRGNYVTSSMDNPISNSLVSGSRVDVPTFQTSLDETGALTVVHTEFVADIYANTSGERFRNDGYLINPGKSDLFPFGSQIAANFEEYEMIQLMFTYKPKITPNVTSADGQLGTVLMYTDYNPESENKVNKQVLMQSYGTSSGRVTDTIVHGVECDPKKLVGDGHKFIRTHNPSNKQDLKEFDVGLFQIAVMDTPTALEDEVLGELYVSYRFRLRKPRVYSTFGNAIESSIYCAWANDDQNLKTGQQGTIQEGVKNSIEAKVLPNDFGQVLITFPPSFSGHVKIEFSKWSDSHMGDDMEGTPPVVDGNVTFSGHFRPLLTAGTTDVKEHQTFHKVAGNNNAITMFQQETIVNVDQASSGQANTVAMNSPYGGLSTTVSWMIRITRYNQKEDLDGSKLELQDYTP